VLTHRLKVLTPVNGFFGIKTKLCLGLQRRGRIRELQTNINKNAAVTPHIRVMMSACLECQNYFECANQMGTIFEQSCMVRLERLINFLL
jgi:hypothetical protein